MMRHPTILEEIARHNVTKLGDGEGPVTQITKLKITWKARGESTGYAFSVFELTLDPDVGIPVHKHPYPEFFYVLDGRLDFAYMTDAGAVEWLSCTAGESVMAPPNAPHTFHNHSDKPGTFLSVSHYYHEVMLTTAEAKVNRDGAAPTEMSPEVFKNIGEAFEQTQTYVVEA